MAQYLTTGCMLTCTMGTVPMPFIAMPLPGKPMQMGALTRGQITDIVPMMNIPSFVMCRAPANPTVIAATAAPPPGVPKPGACVPVVVTPWTPPSINENHAGIPAATTASQCVCAYGGIIRPLIASDMTRTGTP